MNWTEYTSDPLDVSVKKKIKQHLRTISSLWPADLTSYFIELSKEKRVLHVGCVEHGEAYIRSPNWKHRQISNASTFCLGVDINRSGVELVKSLGFAAEVVDATSDRDLGQRFDVVLVGDVIEHVSDLHGLLRFCERHLAGAGQIVVSTPNPFFAGTVLSSWFSAPAVANFEHTCWVTESTMLELARRIDLRLERIDYPVGKTFTNPVLSALKRRSFRARSTALFTTVCYSLRRR